MVNILASHHPIVFVCPPLIRFFSHDALDERRRIETSLFDPNPFAGITEETFQCSVCEQIHVKHTKFETLSLTFDGYLHSPPFFKLVRWYWILTQYR